jgi:hypothetical protein
VDKTEDEDVRALVGKASIDTTVRIGVINTALLGCKTHSKRTAINTAIGGEFTPQKK